MSGVAIVQDGVLGFNDGSFTQGLQLRPMQVFGVFFSLDSSKRSSIKTTKGRAVGYGGYG